MKLEVNYYSGWVVGWSDKTKLILISTQAEVVVVVVVELGNSEVSAYSTCEVFPDALTMF